MHMTQKKINKRLWLQVEMSVELEYKQLPFLLQRPCRASLVVSVRDFRISFLCIEKSDSVKSRGQIWTFARLFFCVLTFCSQSIKIMFAEFLASLAFRKTTLYDI